MQTKTLTSTLVTTYTYDAANRLATQNGQSSFTWDANGNMLADGSTLYAYDFANWLISTTLSGVNTQFGYNGDGIRLRLIEVGAFTTYTQDYAAPLPVVVQVKTGSASTQYVYSLGTRPVAEYEAAAWEYLLADPLGSVRQLADPSGNVTLLKSYEPYGSVLNGQGSATSIFGYSGEQTDTTGLVYLRARYMQPRLGIFLSRDQWPGDQLRPGSMNGWNYVEGNPVNAVDPSGRVKWKAPKGDEEKAIEWRYEKLSPNFADVQLEYPIPIFQLISRPSWCTKDDWKKFTERVLLRPDIIRSDTGEVYEIEPWGNGPKALVEGNIQSGWYAYLLNEFGKDGLLEGTLKELDIPYNWNRVRWHQGRPADFPFMRLRGTIMRLTPVPTADFVIIDGLLILTAWSPQPGIVLWYYQIDLTGVPLPQRLDRLRQLLRREKKDIGVGEPRPREKVPVARPSEEVLDLLEQYFEPHEYTWMEFFTVPFP